MLIEKIRELFTLESSSENNRRYVRFPQQAALADMGAFNATTGNLAGGCIVRVITDEEPIHILGWVNTHNHDPIAVKLYADGASEWRFCDSIDEEIMAHTNWRKDFEKSRYAPDVLAILQKHSESLFNAGIIAPPLKADRLNLDMK